MSQLERIGISLEKDLLSGFDKLIKKQGYKNRSQAFCDLIRQQISREKIKKPKSKAIAAVCLVYDHHATKLLQKLTHLQHTHLLQTVCSTHVHLDKNDCLEVIVLKGQVSQIHELAEHLLSQKGVKIGKVNLVAPAV
jgi:CopG family nickel-responsive transcriptional regulator